MTESQAQIGRCDERDRRIESGLECDHKNCQKQIAEGASSRLLAYYY
ncbi:hypothetical protein IQ250_04155 [Pseudanabaenaceae cyanobacterium LEGE 13415]|nr:hypothetical protein [Pseudanabaenaceae cyanobacterium LEGE 13415]